MHTFFPWWVQETVNKTQNKYFLKKLIGFSARLHDKCWAQYNTSPFPALWEHSEDFHQVTVSCFYLLRPCLGLPFPSHSVLSLSNLFCSHDLTHGLCWRDSYNCISNSNSSPEFQTRLCVYITQIQGFIWLCHGVQHDYV